MSYTEEDVERVARALYDGDLHGIPWIDADPEHREMYRNDARHALAALAAAGRLRDVRFEVGDIAATDRHFAGNYRVEGRVTRAEGGLVTIVVPQDGPAMVITGPPDDFVKVAGPAGRLLPEDTRTEEQFAVQRRSGDGGTWTSEPYYRVEYAELDAPRYGGAVVRRRAWVGPWVPVPEPEANQESGCWTPCPVCGMRFGEPKDEERHRIERHGLAASTPVALVDEHLPGCPAAFSDDGGPCRCDEAVPEEEQA